MTNIPKSKGLDRRQRPKQVWKKCQFCGRSYKGSPRSKYCSPTHVEQASRYRRKALVEALAEFLYAYCERMTLDLRGRAIQITMTQALIKSEQCIRGNRTGFEYRMMALGYVYDEAARAWRRPPLLR